MKIVCSHCNKQYAEVSPFEDHDVTHGLCLECTITALSQAGHPILSNKTIILRERVLLGKVRPCAQFILKYGYELRKRVIKRHSKKDILEWIVENNNKEVNHV